MNIHNREISRLRVRLSTEKKKMNNSKNQTVKNYYKAGIQQIKSEIVTHLQLKKRNLQSMMNHINRELKIYKNNR